MSSLHVQLHVKTAHSYEPELELMARLIAAEGAGSTDARPPLNPGHR